jgi:hypothetical protein
MSGKHPKRGRGVDPGEPTATSPAALREVSAAELRAQMAILAEQVRQLGHRVDHAADSKPAGPTEAPRPAPPALHHSAMVDPTPEPERAQPDPRQRVACATASPRYTRETVADHRRRLFESVIATAERAALEMRESAEREASRIRARASDDRVAPATDLVGKLERQRQTLAALAAETDRIAQAVAVLGAQTRALDAGRRRSYEALDADRQTQ